MSLYIQDEAALALMSFLLGAVLMISYDLLRLFRLLVPHGSLWTGLEDLFYWIYCAVMTFSLLFWENSGVVRGYVIACVFLAMAAYDRIVSRNVFVLLKKAGRWIKMKIIHTIKDLQTELSELKAQGKKVGLVPTMGALHAGHASLVKRSVNENEVTVVSVFVNPTQFNDKNDLVKYPRTLDADCKLLEACGATYAFAPSVEEMYPEPDTRQFSYAPLDTVMEGAFRPGHFNGVCQIVSKLFEAVKPHRAYFGEKDFQQLAIIREMVRQMQFDLEIVGCPIVREEDGLALSSRNARLSAEERENALKISQTLFKSRTFAATHTVGETLKFVEDAIAAVPGLRLEYFEIVDGNTLQKVDNWNQTSYVVGCITVFCGDVRLIDNIKYKES